MGVQNLWQLLQSTGKPVSLQSLEGKILAVDVSIWLHQAVKGMRDREGNPLPNAHLQVIFSRVCKLLFYRIRPVFVFDGGVPELKKQTLAARRERKEISEREGVKTNRRLVENLMRKHAIKEVLGEEAPSGSGYNTKKQDSQDLFILPPLPESFKKEQEDLYEDEDRLQQKYRTANEIDSQDIDVESADFRSLPTEIQHEVLMTMIQRKKENSWSTMHELPQASDNFSDFQMKKILKKSKLVTRLDEVRKDMNNTAVSDITEDIKDEFNSDTIIQTSKVMSEDSSHIILIKGLSKKRRDEELAKAAAAAVLDEDNQKLAAVLEKDEESEKDAADDLLIDSEEEKRKKEKLTEIDWINSSQVLKSEQKKNENEGKNDKTEVASNLLTVANNEDKISSWNNVVLQDGDQAIDEDKHCNHGMKDTVINSGDCDIDPFTEKGKQRLEDNDVRNHGDICKTSGVLTDKRKPRLEDNDVAIHGDIYNISQQDVIIIDKSFEAAPSTSNASSDDQKNKKAGKSNYSYEEKCIAITSSGDRSSTHILTEDINTAEINKQSAPLGTDASKINKQGRRSLQGNQNYNDTSEDEGFIEVTIDPTVSMEEDELFPSSVFMQQSSEETGDKIPGKIDEIDKPVKKSNLGEQFLQSNDFQVDPKTIIQTDVNVGEDEENFTKSLQTFAGVDLAEFQEELEYEGRSLQQERGKQERLATSITDQMYLEAQELLRLFGVPYIVAPMEAEAQCAFLDLTDQCHGSITDDSDIWLFGGKRVYKNFFNQEKHVEFFKETNIVGQLGLTREQFINIALLCGSDYTLGIQTVGPVTALELMAEFPGPGIQGLLAFKSWWDKAQSEMKVFGESKLKTKLRKLEVKEGFPSKVIVDAYLNPEVDQSKEKFSWATPDLDFLRDFAREKFGWKKDRCDEILLPVLKQVNSKQVQGRIDSYFQPENFLEPKKMKSNRMKQALSKLSGAPEQPSDNANKDKIEQAKVVMMSRSQSGLKGKGSGKGKGKAKATKVADVPMVNSGRKRSSCIIKEEIALSESSSTDDDSETIKKVKGQDTVHSAKGKRTVPSAKIKKIEGSVSKSKREEDEEAESVGSKLKSHFERLGKEFTTCNSGNTTKTAGRGKNKTNSTAGNAGVKKVGSKSSVPTNNRYSEKSMSSNQRLRSQTEISRIAMNRASKAAARDRMSKMEVSESSSDEN